MDRAQRLAHAVDAIGHGVHSTANLLSPRTKLLQATLAAAGVCTLKRAPWAAGRMSCQDIPGWDGIGHAASTVQNATCAMQQLCCNVPLTPLTETAWTLLVQAQTAVAKHCGLPRRRARCSQMAPSQSSTCSRCGSSLLKALPRTQVHLTARPCTQATANVLSMCLSVEACSLVPGQWRTSSGGGGA